MPKVYANSQNAVPTDGIFHFRRTKNVRQRKHSTDIKTNASAKMATVKSGF